MGIINLTPDSFYDGGKLSSEKEIIQQAKKMLEEGATFLDLGGYSSRPGAKFVSEADELNRVLPVVKLLIKEFPTVNLSIDTFRSPIAKKCLENGACMINDISAGLLDPNMLEIIANYQVPLVMMHMRGNPETMMLNTNYKDLTSEVLYFFSERISKARSLGINDIIVDPGFGFSKKLDQNFELFNDLELFSSLKTPVLVGISRKSMIQKKINTSAKESLNGTTALHAIALQKGVSILRVHDVKEAFETISLLQNLKFH
ncbi:MAG: dihydropteroate synthase [Flavobacteriaceae bacterium]|jgi:dihydropteroate synthase|nr:dihydropteroate synthase [Flavobacteriaceae bacterium]